MSASPSKILTCGFSTGNDGYQEHLFLCFDKGDKVHVVLDVHHKDPLSHILLLVRMGEDVEQIAPFDVEEDCFEGHLAISLESFILLVVPGEDLHIRKIADCVPFGNRNGAVDSSETIFAYNPDGRLVKQAGAERKELRYEYDLDACLTKTIDGNGKDFPRGRRRPGGRTFPIDHEKILAHPSL
jgi:YD repeat-containing protein